MNGTEIRNRLEQDGLSSLFAKIYADKEHSEKQKTRYSIALERFISIYGDGDLQIYSAPGRTELAGNHTDHQHGEVFAASINRDAIAIVKKDEESFVRVVSDGFEEVCIDSRDSAKRAEEEGTTAALIRGVLAGLKEHGKHVGGFYAYITSDVLIGAGLSSSAAFEILIGTIESGLYNDGKVSAVELAIIGQYAENVYFGKPCGLMDQMACSVGNLVHIDFADPADPQIEQLSFDFAAKGYCLCITDTKGSHADLTADYAAVPAEMKQAASWFGKDFLREVDEDEFVASIPALRQHCGDRAVLRALHFYDENRRVQNDVAALKRGDFEEFLKGVNASGASSFNYLQNVYTNHDVEHQNVSLALCLAQRALQGEGAVRVHGGGFAGTMQAWVPADRLAAYRSSMDAVFGAGACEVLAIRPCGGTRIL
ncbi:MAG: galactokinase [Lachnospiraceae bacterium]|nr:galactokinase [Lachnospiraceae bacterium]